MIDELEMVAKRPVSRETYERICEYVELLREESARQNLVSAAALEDMWNRHILDSAQLVRFELTPGATWIDVGSGAGLPGVIIACLVDGAVTLSEPRRLRAEFLSHVVARLGLKATVEPVKAERVGGNFEMITGRAVANLARFFGLTAHLSTKNSTWVLPKGRNAESELADAKRAWQGVFHVEPSLTDADSSIIVGREVKARAG